MWIDTSLHFRSSFVTCHFRSDRLAREKPEAFLLERFHPFTETQPSAKNDRRCRSTHRINGTKHTTYTRSDKSGGLTLLQSYDIMSEASSSASDMRETKEAEARARLALEIMAVTKPYRQRKKKPPYSASEMTVMAVVCCGYSSIDKVRVLEWICDSFPYYAQLTILEYAETQAYKITPTVEQPDEIVEGFHDVFNDWRVPLQDNNVTDPVLPVTCTVDHYAEDVCVPSNAGRVFLRNVLEPKRKGAFPFLKLPAELRNTIYEMVFTFPKGGFGVTSGYESKVNLWLLGREFDHDAKSVGWSGREEDIADSDYHLRVRLAADGVFSLLFVNKQIYEEAMPYFYGSNHFHFETFTCFFAFVKGMMAPRADHLSSIGIELNTTRGHTLDMFPTAMKCLSNIRSLRKLQIQCRYDSGGWLSLLANDRQLLGRKRKFTKFGQIPGFSDVAVAACKAEEVVFVGDCEDMEAYVRAEVKKLKANASKEAKPKKRGRAKYEAGKSPKVADAADEEVAKPQKKRAKQS